MHIRYVKCSFWCADLRFYRRKKGKSPPTGPTTPNPGQLSACFLQAIFLWLIFPDLYHRKSKAQVRDAAKFPGDRKPPCPHCLFNGGCVLPATSRSDRRRKRSPATIDTGLFITTVFPYPFRQGGYRHGNTRSLFRLYLTLVLLHYREY